MNVDRTTRVVDAKWLLYCALTFLLAVGCSGDGGSSNESTSSTSEAVTFCDDHPLNYDLLSTDGSTTANLSGTFNGYIPDSITASPSSAGFSAQVQLTVPMLAYPYAPITCTYAYTASGGQFTSPTSTCVSPPPPGPACDYADCPQYATGDRFENATNVSMTITRGGGTGELTGTGDFGDSPEDDGNPCTTDSCSGGTANHVALAAGTSCSDGNVCNGTETCDATLHCVSSGNAPAGTSCSDGNVCNGAETCDGSGVCHSPGNLSDGTPCPDALLCNGTEACQGGSCSMPGTPLTVPASTTCTTSRCDDNLGIVTTTSSDGVCAASYQPTGSATDATLPTDFNGSTSFLYTESTPIQTGVTSGTIVSTQAAVIHGRVLDVDGSTPLPNVVVSILNESKYGQTKSRDDGYYDLAVNGGGQFIVDYQLAGRLPAQRTTSTSWHDYAVIDDLILVPIDTTSPATVTNGSASSQFTTGPSVSDADGARQANVYLPANTSISGYGGSTYTLRATEYTVGDNGPKSMPAPLPPQSAYTYAVDLSVDETANVNFVDSTTGDPKSVSTYVDNFLGLPVGTAVPLGYYDRVNAHWVPSANGVILVLVDSSGGLNVSGTMCGPDYCTDSAATLSALGITADEQTTLAGRYAPGTQLLRLPMTHFTAWDANWGFAFPTGAAPPPAAPPLPPLPPDDPCLGNGSIIECQSQILAEEIPVYGTPYFLRYQSDRVPGRKITITVPITTAAPSPSPLKRVDVSITVAGRRVVLSTLAPIAANQSVTWNWDRTDAFGRFVEGSVPATVRVSYVYGGVQSAEPAQFGGFPLSQLTATHNRSTREATLDQNYTVQVGALDAINLGFGGWSLSAEHSYDSRGILYRGDGRRQTSKLVEAVIQTAAGGGTRTGSGAEGHPATEAQLKNPHGVAVAPDGSVYFADVNDHVVRKIDTSGTISTFAGNYTTSAGPLADGVVATSEPIAPWYISIGPDNYLYIAENGGCRVEKVALDGPAYAYLVAGYYDSSAAGHCAFSGDGGPATSAKLTNTTALTVGPDGTVYVAGGSRIRTVDRNGIINTMAGNGTCNSPLTGPLNGTPPSIPPVSFCSPAGIAVGNDGSVYVGTEGNAAYDVRKITADGIVSKVAGTGSTPSSWATAGDGGPALAASMYPQEIHFGPDGALYMSNYNFSVIQRIDLGGLIQVVAGTGGVHFPIAGDGGPATNAVIWTDETFAFGPDGSMYIADDTQARLRKVYTDGPRSTPLNVVVPSRDGDEIYEFDLSGRHVSTVSTLRGQMRATLSYDPTTHLLSTIADGDGNTTTIDRGTPGVIKIIGPFGNETTTLTLGGNGYLTSVQTPNAETYTITHSDDGLLMGFARPNGSSSFTYDGEGRLTHDTDALGLAGSPGQSLTRVSSTNQLGYFVAQTTAQGLSKTFGMDFTAAGHPTTYPGSVPPIADRREQRTFLSPSGLTSTDQRLTDGSKLVGLADGTLTWTQFAPDPRFGTATPYVSGLTTKKGSHTRVERATKTATLSSATDLFSLTSEVTTDCVNGTGTISTCTGGHKTTTTFSSSPTPAETTTLPSGRQIQRTFDANDRITAVQILGTSPVALNAISYTYDSTTGRLTQVSQGTRAYTTSYDPTTGFVSATTDVALGTSTTNTAWDGDGRPTATTLPGGYSLGRAFDSDGNLKTLTTPNTNEHTLISNGIDLLDTYEPPSSGAFTTYNYDFDHNLAALLDPDGTSVYLRDPGGRVFSTGQVSYSYYSNTDPTSPGKLFQETAGTESRSYTYDGPLVSTITIASSATPSYSKALTLLRDNYFQVTSRQFGGLSSISFGYDPDGYVATAGALTITRGSGSGSNSLVLHTSIGSLTETPTFDAYGALSNDAYGSVYSIAYTRDAGGRVTEKVETISGSSTTITDYVYDGPGTTCPTTANDGRLCQLFSPPGTLVATYTYDADGNRTDIAGYSYDAQDRMLAFNGASYTYTPGGRLLTKTDGTGVTTYTYDVHDNLTDVVFPSAPEVHYRVDAQNRRVARTLGTTPAQEFVYDDTGRIALELDGAGSVVSQFIYGTKANVPDYMINTVGGVSTTYRLVTDQLGSVIMVVNASSPSTIAQQISYDAWGRIVTETNISNGNAADVAFQPFGFAGGVQDRETGFVRFGARDYDPSTGRWVSKDPIRFGGGIDVYAYCHNDPINFIDPRGRSGEGIVSWGEAAWGWAAGEAEAAGQAIFGGGAETLGPPGLIGGGMLAGGMFVSSGNDDATHDDEGPDEGGVCESPPDDPVHSDENRDDCYRDCTIAYQTGFLNLDQYALCIKECQKAPPSGPPN